MKKEARSREKSEAAVAFAGAPELPRNLLPRPPELSAIEVVLPRPKPIPPEDLVQRFEQLRHEHATRKALRKGDALEDGDEAVVDVIAYAPGGKVPEGAMEALRFLAGGETFVPGLAAIVVGHTVGEKFTAKGLKLTIKSGTRLTLPGIGEELLEKLDRGNSVTQVLETLAAEAEQEQVAALESDAMRQVLEAVAQKARPDVPENLIDLEIAWTWRGGQDAALERLGVPTAEREAALKARLNDPKIRADARARIAVTLTLRAIAEAEGLTVQGKDAPRGKTNGVTAELVKALEASPAAREETLQRLTHLRAVDFVMERVKVRLT